MQLGSLVAISTILRFGRNVLIARLLGVEEYGIVSTYFIVLAFVESMTALSLGQFLIRDPDGDKPRVMAVVQLLTLVRACTVALLILAGAEPMSEFLGHPELVNAYRVLALAPFLTGFIHIERVRRQRGLDYAMMGKIECGGVVASIALVTPFALWFADHRIFLAFLLVDMAGKVAISLWLAGRPLSFAWDRGVARRVVSFSWPLLLTSPVVFATMQGDRLIVANQFTPADLGLLSAAVTLAGTPVQMLRRILGSLFYSAISRVRNLGGSMDEMVAFAFETQAVAGAATGLLIAVVGPAALVIVFGEDFRPAAGLIGIVGVGAVLPLMRGGFTSFAMSAGRTVEPLLSSMPRLAVVAIAFVVAARGGSVEDILLVGVAGEFASVLLAMTLFARIAPSPEIRRRVARLYFLTFIVLGAALALHWVEPVALGPFPAPPLEAALVPFALLALLFATCGALRRRILAVVRNRLLRRRR